MHKVRKPREAMSVVASSNSVRMLVMRGMVLPSALTTLVQLLNTISAAPCHTQKGG